MISNCKVGAIVFFVSDLARSVDFYRDTLGLPVQVVDGHDGPFAVGDVGDLSLVFIPRPARAGESPVVVFSLDGGSVVSQAGGGSCRFSTIASSPRVSSSSAATASRARRRTPLRAASAACRLSTPDSHGRSCRPAIHAASNASWTRSSASSTRRHRRSACARNWR